MKRLKSKNRGTGLRKRVIIEAALECFTVLGYHDTAVSDIREKAGVSIGSLYHHFRSKEQLAGAVYLEGILDYQAGFLAALRKETDAEKGILAIVKYHLQWVDGNKSWANYLLKMRYLECVTQHETEFAELNKEFVGRIAAWFGKHISTRAIRRLSPDLYAPILIGPCQEFARSYLDGCSVTKINAAAKELASAIWRALKGEVL